MSLTWRRGLRARIVWSTAALSAAVVAIMAAAVAVIATRLTHARVDASLHDRIAAAQASLKVRPDGSVHMAQENPDEVTDSVWIFDDQGRQLSGPEAGSRVRGTVRRLASVHGVTRLERRERVYLAQPLHVGDSHRSVGVAVASESIEPYESTRIILVGGLVALGVVVSAGSAAATWWTVGRTLAPVRRMTELAAEWSERDLDSRFELVAGEDELSELGDTLDVLLDRVAQAIRSEQRLTSELAHELRTPLSAIRAEAELGLMSDIDADSTERFQRIVRQVDRLSGTISTLLAVARHETGSHDRADLARVLRELVGTRPVELAVAPAAGAGAMEVGAPDELVERVVAPVLDNAVRHARSRVLVEVAAVGHDLVVDVSDDGLGIEQADADSIFEAGVRSPGSDGAGLGLPLAQRVAVSIGGSIEVRSSRSPTTFRVRLPRR